MGKMEVDVCVFMPRKRLHLVDRARVSSFDEGVQKVGWRKIEKAVAECNAAKKPFRVSVLASKDYTVKQVEKILGKRPVGR